MQLLETLLGGLTPEEFLREYWQKKPLLIRGALPGFISPISPEELAGIALEEEAESRLILEEGANYPWQLLHGPFDEEDFASLPESKWTLLVQEVDRWVPEVAELRDAFRFIPSWRIDDVMVSYAPDQGNVGAHIDNYDVFLLQGLGRREWRIGRRPVAEEHLVPDLEVSMLADFTPDDVWTLEPGDMLYLPPRIAHHGIAIGDCMTYSIGFRAPSHEEMLASFHARALELIDPVGRFSDPDLVPTRPDEHAPTRPVDPVGDFRTHPAYVSKDAIEQAKRLIRELYTDANVARWFGALITEPGRAEFILPPDERIEQDDLVEALEAGAILHRVAPNRFAFTDGQGGAVLLFVHGEEYELPPAIAHAAPLLSGRIPLDIEALATYLENDEFRALLTQLVNEGFLELA